MTLCRLTLCPVPHNPVPYGRRMTLCPMVLCPWTLGTYTFGTCTFGMLPASSLRPYTRHGGGTARSATGYFRFFLPGGRPAPRTPLAKASGRQGGAAPRDPPVRSCTRMPDTFT